MSREDIKRQIQKIINSRKTFKKNPRYIYKNIIKYYTNLYKKILIHTNYLNDNCKFTERLYHILNNLDKVPKCRNKNCDNLIKFRSFKNGYAKYCSVMCHNSCDEWKQNRDNNNLKKYGVKNVFQSKEVQDKIKKTMLEIYKVDHNFKLKTIEKNKRLKKLEENKQKELNQFKSLKEKVIFLMNKFDRKHISLSTKIQYRDLYNEIVIRTNYLKNNVSFLERLYNISYDLYDLQKCKMCNTIVKFSGYSYGYKKYCLNHAKINIETSEKRKKSENKRKQKEYQTKKKNHSFKSSKSEQLFKQFLEKNNIKFKYQYKDIRYPFMCDFYLIDNDMFVELNLHWTHCGCTFNKNNKIHLEKLKYMQEKAKDSQFYKNAISVWTIRDPKKREIAKKNNLNYLEIFNINNIENILMQIH